MVSGSWKGKGNDQNIENDKTILILRWKISILTQNWCMAIKVIWNKVEWNHMAFKGPSDVLAASDWSER